MIPPAAPSQTLVGFQTLSRPADGAIRRSPSQFRPIVVLPAEVTELQPWSESLTALIFLLHLVSFFGYEESFSCSFLSAGGAGSCLPIPGTVLALIAPPVDQRPLSKARDESLSHP